MRILILASVGALALAGAASAQTAGNSTSSGAHMTPSRPVAAMTTTTSGRSATTKAMGRPAATSGRSAISKGCSAQADAKALHGKDRQKFRNACMRSKA